MIETVRDLQSVHEDLKRIIFDGELQLIFDRETFNKNEFNKSSITRSLLERLESRIKDRAKFGKNWDITIHETMLVVVTEKFRFETFFSSEDDEYVTTCNKYQSLSSIEKDENDSFEGMLKLLTSVMEDDESGTAEVDQETFL